MLGAWFYNARTRKAVATFGSLFNNIYVLDVKKDGQVLNQTKVPISYGPRRKFLERIDQMNNGEDLERSVAIKLPRMSFEIVNFAIDQAANLPKTNTIPECLLPDVAGASNAQKAKMWLGVPYILTFQLNIYGKKLEDVYQILEQIIPYFQPQYTATIKPFPGSNLEEDSSITLQSIAPLDDYEGPVENRRTIIYTLDFEMKVRYYGATSQLVDIIRNVQGDIYNMEGDRYQSLVITPDPADVSPDSDYTLNIELIPGWDSA